MTNLNLNEQQVQLLEEVLDSTLADLGYEIRNTPTYDYRQKLKEKRDELNDILTTLHQTH